MPFTTAANAVAIPNPLNQNNPPNANSVATFMNDLFNNGAGQVRHPATMIAGMVGAAQNDDEGYWLIDGNAQTTILLALLSPWRRQVLGLVQNNAVQPSDRDLMIQMAQYVQQNQIAMFVPNITYVGLTGANNQTPIYELNGYTRTDLFLTPGEIATPNGGPATIKLANIVQFLRYFLTGAHVVVINSTTDAPNAAPAFWTLFQTARYFGRQAGPLNPYSGAAYMHSHYSGSKGLGNAGAAYAFPNTVTTENAPSPCPWVCSLLVDTTAHRDPNTFIQLEGWPGTAQGWYGARGRHHQDFDVHGQTKWNIGTYGASPFSEKRGTTLFLAPNTWQPDVRGTIWTAYQGTKTVQRWYESSLIRPSNPLQ